MLARCTAILTFCGTGFAVGVGVGVTVTVTTPMVTRVLLVVSVTVASCVTVTASAVALKVTVVAEGTMLRQWQAEETRDVSYVGGSQSGYSIDRLALFLGVGAAAETEAGTVTVMISSNTVETSVTTTVVVSEAVLLHGVVLISVQDVA